jgi:hypothetical protein
MGVKADYDPVTKLVELTETPLTGEASVDVQIDLYSDAKEDWLADEYLSRFTFPWVSIGGQPTGGGKLAGQLFFLRNDLGWRIKPFEADHQLLMEGNLFGTDPNTDVYTPTTGEYSVLILNTRSNLATTVGVSGMTATESHSLTNVEKIIRNRTVTDPDSGTQFIFDDDGISIFLQAALYEDATGTQRYRGQGAQLRERLE